jgi:hypothetical protein
MKSIICPYCKAETYSKSNSCFSSTYECSNHNMVNVSFVVDIISGKSIIEYTYISIEKIKINNIMYTEDEGYVEDEEYYQYLLSINNGFNLASLIKYDKIELGSHTIAKDIPAKNWTPENFENKLKLYLTFQ